MTKLKQFHVRSRETRVFDWYVMAPSAEAAQDWVQDQEGDTEKSSADSCDSTEIMDAVEVPGECRNSV